MKETINMLDFHLFDGDGGGAGASSGSAAGSGEGGVGNGTEGLNAEARAFMKELGITDDDLTTEVDASTETEPTVVYGKTDGPEGNVGGGQVGSDHQTAESASTDDLEAEFAELIGKGGRFEQIYGQKVAERISQRFKNSEDLQGKVSAYDDALAPLYAKYGLKAGDIEGMAKAIEGDDDIYASGAEAEGLTTEKYKENLRLKMDAQKGRSMMEEMQRQQQMQATFARWDAEAEELKAVFPSFNIEAELANPEFEQTLNRVGNVKDAFMITHMNDILSGNTEMAAQQTRQQMVDTMKRKAARPAENGVRTSPAIVRKSDPSKLNDEDMDKIFAQVEAGGKISF